MLPTIMHACHRSEHHLAQHLTHRTLSIHNLQWVSFSSFLFPPLFPLSPIKYKKLTSCHNKYLRSLYYFRADACLMRLLVYSSLRRRCLLSNESFIPKATMVKSFPSCNIGNGLLFLLADFDYRCIGNLSGIQITFLFRLQCVRMHVCTGRN